MGVVLNLIVTEQLNSISNDKVMTVQSMTAISIFKYFLSNNTEKHSNKKNKKNVGLFSITVLWMIEWNEYVWHGKNKSGGFLLLL